MKSKGLIVFCLLGLVFGLIPSLARAGSISGTVSYDGSKSGTLAVAISTDPYFEGEPFAATTMTVSGSFSNLEYSLPNLPDGTYYLLSLISTMNDLDQIQKYDPWYLHGGKWGSLTPINVSGGSNEIISFTLVDGTDINPCPFYEEPAHAWSQHWSNGYSVHFNVEDDAHSATSVSVTGPGITTARNLDYDNTNKEWNSWHNNKSIFFGATYPTPPLTYYFTITEPSTVTYATAVVRSFVQPFATNLSPTGTVISSTPTFSWTGVSGVPENYTYSVELNSPYGQIWRADNLTATSKVYSGPPLIPGTNYQYNIQVVDNYWSSSFASAEFTYNPGGAPPPPTTSSIQGTVKDAENTLLANAKITVKEWVEGGGESTVAQTYTSAAGTYTVTGLESRKYNIECDPPSGEAYQYHKSFKEEDIWVSGPVVVDFTLPIGGIVEGSVTNYSQALGLLAPGTTGFLIFALPSRIAVTPQIFGLEEPESTQVSGNGTYQIKLRPDTWDFYLLCGKWSNEGPTALASAGMISVNLKIDARGTITGKNITANIGTAKLNGRIGTQDEGPLYQYENHILLSEMTEFGEKFAGYSPINIDQNTPSQGNYEIANLIPGTKKRIYVVTRGYRLIDETLDLSANQQLIRDYTVEKSAIVTTEKKTITVRGALMDESGNPIDDGKVGLFDSGGYWDYRWENDMVVGYARSSGSWLGTNPYYNFEITNAEVVVSQENMPWYYILRSGKPGYFSPPEVWTLFTSSDTPVYIPAGIDKNQMQPLKLKPPSALPQISNLKVEPTTISPDQDGIDDQTRISFDYTSNADRAEDMNGMARVTIDTKRDGNFNPFDWGLVIHVGQPPNEQIYLKWDFTNDCLPRGDDPNYFIDFNRLNDQSYLNGLIGTKIKGPFTWDDINFYTRGYDWSRDWWINGNDLWWRPDHKMTMDFMWEGRDNSWYTVPDGTYTIRIQVDTPFWNEDDGVDIETTTVVQVRTESIFGRVTDTQGNAVVGAKVNAGSPYAWGETITDSTGNYKISGLKATQGREPYWVNVEAVGYSSKGIGDIAVPRTEPLNFELEKGGKLTVTVTMPNPPTIFRDQWGNEMRELWGGIDAWSMTGKGGSWKSIKIDLTVSTRAFASATEDIYLAPGSYNVRAHMPEYTSETQTVEIGTFTKTLSFTLQKASMARGWVILPSTAGMNFNPWVNINATSTDTTKFGWGGTQINVLEGKTSAQYEVRELLPGAYNFRFNTFGLPDGEVTNVTISGPVSNVPDFRFSRGGDIEGKVSVYGDVSKLKIREEELWKLPPEKQEQVRREGWPGYPLWMEAFSPRTGYHAETVVWLSTNVTTAQTNIPYVFKGLSPGEYYVNTRLSGFVIEPLNPESRKATVVADTSATGPSISLKTFSGILVGKVSANGIDFTKVKVNGFLPPRPEEYREDDSAFFFSVTPNTQGNYRVAPPTSNGIGTGDYIVWVNEYDESPGFGEQMNPMGKPTGRFGTSLNRVSLVNGTTNTFDVSLLPGATVYGTITVQSSSYTIQAAKNIQNASPWYSIVWLTPVRMRWWNIPLPEENGGNLIPAILKDVYQTSATYVVNGLEEGMYAFVPYANFDPQPPEGDTDQARQARDNYWRNELWRADLAGEPNDVIVELRTGETKAGPDFVFSDGFKIKGTIERPSSGEEDHFFVELWTLRGQPLLHTSVDFEDRNNNKSQRSATFSLGPISPGKYVLKVWPWQYKYKVATKEIEIVNQNYDVTIRVSKGATLKGKLVDAESGTAIYEGVRVQCEARPYVEGSWREIPDERSEFKLETSSQTFKIEISSRTGEFSFGNLPQGSYILRITGIPGKTVTKNYVGAIVAGIDVPDSTTEVDAGTIKLRKGTTISGRVTDAQTSKPVAGIRMRALPVGVKGETIESKTLTDAEGRYSLTGIDPLKVDKITGKEDPNGDFKYLYDVYAAVAPEFNEGVESKYPETIRRSVSPGSSGIDFALGEAKSYVTGQVLPALVDGATVPLRLPFDVGTSGDFRAAFILVQSPEHILTGDPMAGLKSFTDPKGQFRLGGLEPGTKYFLKVMSLGAATLTRQFTAQEGENNIGSLRLRPGAMVSGTLSTPEGKKLSTSDFENVVAVSEDMETMVFGVFSKNNVTLEIDSYTISGLETIGGKPTKYYIALVAPSAADIFVAPGTVNVVKSTETHTKNIVYAEIPPMFTAKGIKVPITPSYVLYFVYVYSSKALKETSVDQIVTKSTATGQIIMSKLSDDRQEMYLLYKMSAADITREWFSFNIKGHDVKGNEGTDEVAFYLGEDLKNEKKINAVTGGKLEIGEGDPTSLSLPAGAIQDEAAISTGTKAIVKKVKVQTTSAPRYSAAAYSFPMPTPMLTTVSSTTIGAKKSDYYDMRLTLARGPLKSVSLASGKTATVSIKYDSSTISASDLEKLNVCRWNGTEWVPVTTGRKLDPTNATISADTSGLSTFAAFVVTVTTGPAPYTGAFKTYVYPNPYRPAKDGNLNIKYFLPSGSANVKVKIKIYTLVGELTRTIDEGSKSPAAEYATTWNAKNDDAEAVASGVYFYAVELDDKIQKDHIKKIAVIK